MGERREARARPWVLVIAGHDPSGGAGVDADREALLAAGAEGALVVATQTEQDGRQVRAFGARPLEAWLAEARAHLDERGSPAAAKVGLLVDAGHVRAVAALFREDAVGRAWRVVDPVLAASGGERFADAAVVSALLEDLVPTGVVLTPNVPEAAELTDADAEELAADPGARVAAARRLLERGARAVVLKGGHGSEDPVQDLVLEAGGAPRWLAHPRVAGASLHGSGCRFASFLAGRLAHGERVEAAARAAGLYLAARLADRGSGGA